MIIKTIKFVFLIIFIKERGRLKSKALDNKLSKWKSGWNRTRCRCCHNDLYQLQDSQKLYETLLHTFISQFIQLLLLDFFILWLLFPSSIIINNHHYLLQDSRELLETLLHTLKSQFDKKKKMDFLLLLLLTNLLSLILNVSTFARYIACLPWIIIIYIIISLHCYLFWYHRQIPATDILTVSLSFYYNKPFINIHVISFYNWSLLKICKNVFSVPFFLGFRQWAHRTVVLVLRNN